MNSEIENVYCRIMKTEKLQAGGVVGCSEEEIAELEIFSGCRLPETYREFLRLMGKKAGQCFVGTDMFFDKVESLKEYANDLLLEMKSDLRLREGDFVFAVHQGYQFLFFNVDAGQSDPAVYYYREGMPSFFMKYSSFSGYLVSCIDEFDEMLS